LRLKKYGEETSLPPDPFSILRSNGIHSLLATAFFRWFEIILDTYKVVEWMHVAAVMLSCDTPFAPLFTYLPSVNLIPRSPLRFKNIPFVTFNPFLVFSDPLLVDPDYPIRPSPKRYFLTRMLPGHYDPVYAWDKHSPDVASLMVKYRRLERPRA